MKLDKQQDVTTSRGRFHVRSTGGDGFPLVMLHGWPESSWCWAPVTQRLPEQFRVIAPDLRGLGDSERTLDKAAYQKHELAQDVLSVLDELGIDRFHLVGHDWGGVVAQEVALAVPDRVVRFCLMNMLIVTNPAGNREALDKAWSRGNFHSWYQHFQQLPNLAEGMIPGNEDTWLRHFFGKTRDTLAVTEEALQEYVRYYRIPGTPTTGANYYRTMRDDAKRWQTLADRTFPMPSLYILGNQDRVIIPEYLNHIDDAFESVRVKQVEAGHFVQEEQPDAVAQYLAEFLLDDNPA